jgi:hypothetical protein
MGDSATILRFRFDGRIVVAAPEAAKSSREMKNSSYQRRLKLAIILSELLESDPEAPTGGERRIGVEVPPSRIRIAAIRAWTVLGAVPDGHGSRPNYRVNCRQIGSQAHTKTRPRRFWRLLTAEELVALQHAFALF